MLVEKLLPAAREKLATIADNAPLIEAAKTPACWDRHHGCVRFCRLFGRRHHQDGRCQPDQRVSGVQMDGRSFIRDGAGCCPLPSRRLVARRLVKNEGARIEKCSNHGSGEATAGSTNARDTLQALLQEVQDAELLLRDYVMGVGYH